MAYDGTDFCGWQKQEPPADEFGDGGVEGSKGEVVGRVVKDGVERVQLRTVQHVLERAVRDALREEVVLTGASRTDSGVHAWGLSACFVSEPMGEKGVGWPADRGVEKLVKAVNGRLPRDVWVRSVEVVGDDFNVIGGATSKEYTYTIACGEARPIFGRRYVWHTWYDLDVAKMNEAARVLIGEHDFAGFAQINHGRKTTVREIFDCSVEEIDGGNDVVGIGGDGVKLVRVRVSGSGFLYNMVRIVAGTLVEVGRGKMSVDDVRRVVAEADRLSNRGMTLPPMGLRLEWIRYGDEGYLE
ncbi:MAG: tRNA pseudouridine synthase A [Phycisphaerales bacterium]|nr:tRNA pseudouridine synthase A [Phycisphaerales bacterium]